MNGLGLVAARLWGCKAVLIWFGDDVDGVDGVRAVRRYTVWKEANDREEAWHVCAVVLV